MSNAFVKSLTREGLEECYLYESERRAELSRLYAATAESRDRWMIGAFAALGLAALAVAFAILQNARVLAVALALAVAAGPAAAQCSNAAPVAYAQAAVAYPAAVVSVLPAVFVPVPSYTVGLSAPDPDAAAKLDALVKRFDAVEARLVAPATPANVLPLKAPEATAAGVLRAACVRCHAGAAEKGGGLAIDPDRVPPELLRKVLARTLDGSMPPGKPLPPESRAAVLTLVR